MKGTFDKCILVALFVLEQKCHIWRIAIDGVYAEKKYEMVGVNHPKVVMCNN